MAIGTNDLIDKFGTQDEVSVASPSAITNNSFSVAGDVSAWTNDDDAPAAMATLECTFGTAPTLGSNVNLYARLLNVVSTSDQVVPSASFLHTFLGAFPVDDVTATQLITLEIPLPNASTSQQYEFYLENRTGQTMSAGWSLYITPKTLGPHV